MAAIDLSTVTETPSQSSGTTYTLQLPPAGSYAVGDVLMGFITNNSGTTSIAQSGGSDWNVVAGQANTTNVRSAVVYKKAGSTSEANPTFTVTSAAVDGLSWVCKGVDATTQVEASLLSTAGSATSLAHGAVSSSSDNALAIFCAAQNSTSNQLRFKTDEATALNANVNLFSSAHHQVAFRQLGAAGSVPAATVYGAGSTNMQLWTIVVKNATGGPLMPWAKSGLNELVWYGSHGSAAGAITNSTPSNFAGGASINGIATSAGATTFSTTTTALDWGYYTSYSSTETLSKWVGNYHAYTFPDMTGKVISFEWLCEQSPSSAQIGADGHIFALTDGTSILAYQIAPKATGAWVQSQWERVTVELGVTTPYWTSGTAANAISGAIGILYATQSNGTAGTKACRIRNLCILDKATIVGGGASMFATWDAAFRALTSCGIYKVATKQGATQYLFNCGVQVGDGAIPLYFKPSPQAFEMSPPYNSKTQPWWRVSADKFGVTWLPSSSDTIDPSASSLVTTQSALFSLDASASVSAAYNWQSTLAVGFNATWSAAVDMAGMTFKGGKTVTLAAAADWSNFIVSATTSSNAAMAITATGATLSGGTIDLSGVSANYHLELGTAVVDVGLASQAFSGAAVVNEVHALKTSSTVAAGAFVVGKSYRIKTVGTTDFTLIGAAANTIGESFTATGAGSGTGDAYAAVKITTSGTTTIVEADATTAGAPVWVAAPALYQSVEITGLKTTYRLQLFDIEYDLTVSGVTVTPTAGATYTHNGVTWTVRSASITAGSGTVTVYGTGTPAASGALTKTSGTGDATLNFSAYAVGGTELYIGVPGATSYTWTDPIAATNDRVIRVRVMEDGPGTADAIIMIDAIVGMCGTTDGTETVGYLVAAVADDVYNDRGVDGSTITGITIDDTTLRLEIASGTIINFNGTDVLVVDGRDVYAYETYWLGTTAGMRDEARFIEAVDAVNFRCSRFKFKGTSGYPILIRNCYMVDAATGIFASLVDYSGDPISNAPDHMAAIVVSTSAGVVTGDLSDFIAAVPSAASNATAARTELAPELAAMLRAEKWARNKQILNPGTGTRVVYDDDGTTVLGQGNAYMDADGTQLYDGTGPVHRTERLA